MPFFLWPSSDRNITAWNLKPYLPCCPPTILPEIPWTVSARNLLTFAGSFRLPLKETERSMPFRQNRWRILPKGKYRIYGELINTYGYGLEEGCKSFKALNYYTNEEVTIPLDPTLTPGENAKKYFDRYTKLKRTEEALTGQIAETESEIEHLESISNALDIARAESDLSQIKEELTEYGFIKNIILPKRQKNSGKIKALPLCFQWRLWYLCRKNNFQNDELTFKQASGNDWWFHAKKWQAPMWS